MDYFLICGDFNLVVDPNLDSYNYKSVNNPHSRRLLLSSISNCNWKDIFRELHPNTKRYTWRRKKPLKQARLDYLFAPSAFLDNVNTCIIRPGYRSDHSFLELTIATSHFIKGRGTWKFNCSLLKNKDYLIKVNNLIASEKLFYAARVYNPININRIPDENLQFTIDDCLFLENLLAKIRGETIRFSSRLKKEKSQRALNLEKEIETLENDLDEDKFEILTQKKDELQKLRKDELEGLKIRTRAVWLMEGEKPSKYLSSLETQTYIDKTIRKLVSADGSILTEQKAILDEVRAFYTNLFQKQPQKNCLHLLNDFETNKHFKKLSDQQSNSLEHGITLSELSNALKNMKNGKTPGIDGFPAEFFKVFWGQLKHFVHRSASLAYEKGIMSFSFRHCIISCIPKGNKDRTLLKNWRPISLLSVPYKMLSTVVASRIKSVLNLIISPTQTGFLPGRFIGENTRLIYDLLHFTQKENIPGLLVLIDFQKAFDSVSWEFLMDVLKMYNFGPNICR